MSRRSRVVVAIAPLLIALVTPSPVRAAASALPDNIHLTWSESPSTTQTITWRTDATVTRGRVEYAAVGSRATSVDAPPGEAVVTDVGAISLFSVTLRNLQPGTSYLYRVGDGASWSAYYSFRTEDAEARPFEFIVLGDSHEKKATYNVWRETVTGAYRQNPDARFVMSVGDLIYAGRDYGQWDAWFAACQGVIANIPDMPAIGDHEPRGLTSKDKWQRPEYFVKLFQVPQNGPDGLKGEVYSFDYGYAHIAVLNSSFTYEFADPSARQAMIDAQVAWLDRDLGATAKPWKIVVYHDATYNLRANRSGTLTKVHFGPVIDKHHVDVVFNGHEHALARSYYMRAGDFVNGPGAGTVYYIAGRSGDNAKESLGRKIWHPFFYDPQAQACYLVTRVAQDRLTITARLQDGAVVDTFVIDKARPAEGTPAVPFGAYRDVRFAAFGGLLQFGKAPERDATGEWFVDINALANYMSGSFDPSTNTLSYSENEIQLHLSDDTFLDASKRMVSLAGLRAVGFYCKYHAAMNLVMVERWSD
jgi:hypothetical protein